MSQILMQKYADNVQQGGPHKVHGHTMSSGPHPLAGCASGVTARPRTDLAPPSWVEGSPRAGKLFDLSAP